MIVWTLNFILTLIHARTMKTTSAKSISRKRKTGWPRTGGGYRVFCNPPYGRDLKRWVEKAYREGCKDNTLVVLLIPARTDTTFFHDFIMHRSEIRFISGRLRFNGHTENAPFPSMIAVFRGPKMQREEKKKKGR